MKKVRYVPSKKKFLLLIIVYELRRQLKVKKKRKIKEKLKNKFKQFIIIYFECNILKTYIIQYI